MCRPRRRAHSRSSALSAPREAALQGRDLDGNAATFEAYYDTTQNIGVLADAYVQRAAVRWVEAVAFLNGLNVHGVTGWRLPRTPVLDATCSRRDGIVSSGGWGALEVKWATSSTSTEFPSRTLVAS